MRFLIQRVKHAAVSVQRKTDLIEKVSGIEKGLLILVGISMTDTTDTADKMLKKAMNLRIFEDAEGKTNLSLKDVNGSCLIVSQFTLYASCKKGNRPSFTEAGNPHAAEELYDYIVLKAQEYCGNVQCGEFGADMKVELLNDGPFTVWLDSNELGY